MIKEDFLQQNGYSDYDQYCPLWKTAWMMKNMMTYHDEAQKAIVSYPLIPLYPADWRLGWCSCLASHTDLVVCVLGAGPVVGEGARGDE